MVAYCPIYYANTCFVILWFYVKTDFCLVLQIFPNIAAYHHFTGSKVYTFFVATICGIYTFWDRKKETIIWDSFILLPKYFFSLGNKSLDKIGMS